jgi:hypothetical protein
MSHNCHKSVNQLSFVDAGNKRPLCLAGRTSGCRGDATNCARAGFPGLIHRRTAPAENLGGFGALGSAAAFTGWFASICPFSLFGRLCLRSTSAPSPYFSCDASNRYAGSSMTTNTHSTQRFRCPNCDSPYHVKPHSNVELPVPSSAVMAKLVALGYLPPGVPHRRGAIKRAIANLRSDLIRAGVIL